MVGAYTDPVFGQIQSESYFEVVPPAYAQSSIYIDSFRATTFDSLAIILKPDGSYVGDTTKPLHVEVNRLAESIIPYDNSILDLYNTRSFAAQSQPIGTKNFLARPKTGESIIIRLDDNVGKELLKKFQDPNDGDVRSNDAFLQYLYGLRLSAGAGSQLILGTMDSAIVRLYYKKPGLYLENRILDFTLANKAHHFNHITVNRSGTVLKDIATARQVNSTAMNNTAYTLYAAGVMAKIRFPSIRDVLKLPNFAKVLKATLLIRPLRGTYGPGSYTLPPEMRLSFTTQLNQIGSDLSTLDNSGVGVTQTGGLQIDNLYGESTDYAYDVTAYIKSIMADGTVNGNGLLVIPPSPALVTQFGRLIMGNRDNTNGKMELLIVYAAIQ